MINPQIILFLFVLIIGLGLLFWIVVSSNRGSRLDREDFAKRWRRIEVLRGQGETAWQLAIIEADKLLDQALQANGYPGKTMGERLRDARSALADNDGVWQAHKLRNQIAHENDVRLNKISVDRALGKFKAALKSLGAL
ncbi:MAG TPA: hypothetical protein VNX65_01280 [Patescibacteria group bacterium]|jgi:hypothetical protein|nr:hypothetical protein [Patescibacteria group bacterium]